MQKKKVRIGWYCPYVFIPLAELNGVQPVRISWENYQNASLGSVKLCKKLSAVIDAIEYYMLDGLVTVNCCNLSGGVYGFLKETHKGLFIHPLTLPAKVSPVFIQILLEEWEKLRNALEEVKEYGSISITGKPEDPLEGKGLPADFSNNPGWCTVPCDFKSILSISDYEEKVRILTKKVFCPRLYEEEKGGAGRLENLPRPEDRECILQNYCILADQWLSDKG